MPGELRLDTRVQDLTAGDEAETLLFALERARAQFAWKLDGLDAVALRREFPPSAMTLAGLIKHLALVEELCVWRDLTGEPPGDPWRLDAFEADPEWEWNSAQDDSPAALYALWSSAVAKARQAWAEALAGGGLDRASRTVRDDGRSPNLRRVLADLITEYSRHTGHADLFREAIDGLVGEDPPQY